jgi:hypothetical protein
MTNHDTNLIGINTDFCILQLIVVWVLTHAPAHYSSGVGVRQGGVAVKER